jgi:hypothetical protein
MNSVGLIIINKILAVVNDDHGLPNATGTTVHEWPMRLSFKLYEKKKEFSPSK